jgi:hypothetical protein
MSTLPDGHREAPQGIEAYDLVVTPAAAEHVGDESAVRRLLHSLLPAGQSKVDEVELWRGPGEERVVAFINDHVGTIYVEDLGGSKSRPERDRALRVICLGIGSRPDLPPGKDYVKRVAQMWKSFLPDDDS